MRPVGRATLTSPYGSHRIGPRSSQGCCCKPLCGSVELADDQQARTAARRDTADASLTFASEGKQRTLHLI